MTLSAKEIRRLMSDERYPRSARYDPQWIIDNGLGSHCLWLMETLTQAMDLRPGMRVLDMGCGKAIEAIFLAKEFGVQVWATDLWVAASDNWQRICAAGVQDRVYPIYAEARALPYADGFFDAIVGINTLQFYGTDDLYLQKHLGKLVRPGGQIGMVMPGLLKDFEGGVPAHLQEFWSPDFNCWHTVDWWRRHWEQSGMVDVELADDLPGNDGWQIWLRWQQILDKGDLIHKDRGQYITFLRMVGRRKTEQGNC